MQFLPTAVFAYLRPDSVLVTSTFPFVAFHYSGFEPYARASYVLLPVGGAYIEPVSSLTSNMALPCLLVFGGALAAVRRTRTAVQRALRERDVGAAPVLLLAALSAAVITLTNVAVTNRYVGDLFPFTALATSVAFAHLAPHLDRLRPLAWRALLLLAGVGIAWGILVNMGLQYLLIWG